MKPQHTLMAVTALVAAGLSQAQPADPLQVRSWAAVCDACHGTPSHAQPGMIALAGTPQAVIVQKMLEFNDDAKADVINIIPSMRAGDVAANAGPTTANKRWCEVDFLTFESQVAKNVHVLGDSIQIAPGMPKSGHMATQHGKTCAAAVVALLTDQAVNTLPIYNNTCYSFVSAEEVVHVASVHRYDAAQKTMLTVPGSGGVSSAANALEAHYALVWARNIWADTLA